MKEHTPNFTSQTQTLDREMGGIDDVLGEFAIHIILSKLDPNDTTRVACVNKKFKTWASDDTFWALHCSRDLSLTSPIDPNGNPAPSFKVAYQLWRGAFSLYPWPLVKRVKMCWDKIKSWLGNNFPEVVGTIRQGATENQLNEVEKILDVKLPLTTRLIYRMHNGQEGSEKLLGLIGGYTVYDHLVNVYLLSLSQIVNTTMRLSRYLGFFRNSKNVAIATSLTGDEKGFFLNCATMQLSVGTSNLRARGEMIPCVPNSVLMSNDVQKCDGLLLWLEEHGRRLESGMVTIREEDNMKSISQFPEKPPLCTTAVTNGVQVRASAVLVPEQSDSKHSQFFFAYSIRMSLLPEGCTVHGMIFRSCQLYWRRWIIRENENITHDVNGEAVIGKYPLLLSGEKEFFYQSRTNQKSLSGSIEGSFTFVPGRLMEPKGDHFEVEVPRFYLEMPEYIF